MTTPLPLSSAGRLANALLTQLTDQTAAAAQQPGATRAENLRPLAETLATIAPQLAALPPEERAHLQEKFTALLAMLDSAISRLTTARDDTRQQLNSLRNRATALAAYHRK